MGIPAPALHKTWAVNCQKTSCCGCGDGRIVLHHDHLADYALYILGNRLTVLGLGHLKSELFQKFATQIPSLVRFPPIWICQTCNNGDGRGKAPEYMSRRIPLYVASFSMTHPELMLVRKLKGSPWLTVATMIWSCARFDHSLRRVRVRSAVTSFLEKDPRYISRMQALGK